MITQIPSRPSRGGDVPAHGAARRLVPGRWRYPLGGGKAGQVADQRPQVAEFREVAAEGPHGRRRRAGGEPGIGSMSTVNPASPMEARSWPARSDGTAVGSWAGTAAT